MINHHKLCKVDASATVCIIHSGDERLEMECSGLRFIPKHVSLHIFRVFFWESLLHHQTKIFCFKFASWMIGKEGVECLSNLILSESTGAGESLHILTAENRLPALVTHQEEVSPHTEE